MPDDCIHGLIPATCSICKHGVTRRSTIPEVTTCRSCGAEVRWAETERGAKMPIDADPAEDGGFRLVGHFVQFVKPANRGGMLPEDLYTSHFATCPDGEDWRRSR